MNLFARFSMSRNCINVIVIIINKWKWNQPRKSLEYMYVQKIKIQHIGTARVKKEEKNCRFALIKTINIRCYDWRVLAIKNHTKSRWNNLTKNEQKKIWNIIRAAKAMIPEIRSYLQWKTAKPNLKQRVMIATAKFMPPVHHGTR